MLRFWFILVVGLGIASAMLNRMTPSASPLERGELPSNVQVVAAPSDSQYESATSNAAATYSDGTIQLERSGDGHFYADVTINGAPVHMLIDTGASGIALSREDARSAGLATSIGMNNVVGEGAGGAVRGEYVRLDRVVFGHKSAEGLEAAVLDGGTQSLLGQSFLRKFASVEIQGDRMVLR